MKVRFSQINRVGVHRGCWILSGGSNVSQNSGIKPTIKSGIWDISRQSTDPIIPNWLISIELETPSLSITQRGNNAISYNERVTLSSKDLKAVDSEGLCIDTVRLDDRHFMIVNGKVEIGLARHRDQAETVSKYRVSDWIRDARESASYRFPCSTVITAKSEVGPPKNRPRPLMRVESGVLPQY